MGYETDYKLTTEPRISQEKYLELLLKTSDYEWWEIEGEGLAMSAKWYNHEDHMKTVSLMVKDVLFKLEGDGEEAGDEWIKYFKNGKSTTCNRITVLEEFKEENLK